MRLKGNVTSASPVIIRMYTQVSLLVAVLRTLHSDDEYHFMFCHEYNEMTGRYNSLFREIGWY